MKGSNVTLRPATGNDGPTVYDFICELESITFPKEKFLEMYHSVIGEPDKFVTVALVDGEVVGVVSCYFQNILHHCGVVAEIQELFVRAGERGLGIGKRLIDDTLAMAKARGALQVEVSTSVARKDAQRFYLRENFQFTHHKFVYTFPGS